MKLLKMKTTDGLEEVALEEVNERYAGHSGVSS